MKVAAKIALDVPVVLLNNPPIKRALKASTNVGAKPIHKIDSAAVICAMMRTILRPIRSDKRPQK